MQIPDSVAGRPVTNRGVHMLPAGYHAFWMQTAGYWIDLLHKMSMSWVVIITDGDSVLEQCQTDRYGQISPLELLLSQGIIPIVRDGTQRFPTYFLNLECVRRAVPIYAEHDLRPFWILYNEPFDEREWKTKIPKDRDEAWRIVAGRWMHGAADIARAGGYVGFPDGPCYDRNPFDQILDARWLWDEGHAFYTAHTYGKGRPWHYPYDPVTRAGFLLTDEAYGRMLDEFASDRQWWEESTVFINGRRSQLANPNANAIEDDTCFRGWEKIGRWAEQALGYVPPMALTEGGWQPRDRAGTGPNTDVRWPHTTPRMVGYKTAEMYELPSPFFALCPWLLADDAMVQHGYVGWPYDSWVGWAYSPEYGREKPVVDTLRSAVPDAFDLWILDANGAPVYEYAQFARGYGLIIGSGTGREFTLRLIYETAHQSGAEVWVVDERGLPIPHTMAYAQQEHLAGEVGSVNVQFTDEHGRVSFPILPTAERVTLWAAGGESSIVYEPRPGGCHLGGMWCRSTTPSSPWERIKQHASSISRDLAAIRTVLTV